jgi:DNA-binding NtrC family response regulator
MNQSNSKKYFIVDDDPFWTEMLSQLIKDISDANIITFTNGTDCVNNLHLDPSVVFLDYEMEDMNGIEVLQKIKESHPDVVVIFCTANEDLSVAVDALKYGSYDYLLKSNASKRELLRLLENNQ